jgi:hypothetical protein
MGLSGLLIGRAQLVNARSGWFEEEPITAENATDSHGNKGHERYEPIECGAWNLGKW